MFSRIAIGGMRVFGQQVASQGGEKAIPVMTRATISMGGKVPSAYANPNVQHLPFDMVQKRFFSYDFSLRNPDNKLRHEQFINKHVKEANKITRENFIHPNLTFSSLSKGTGIGTEGGEPEGLEASDIERFNQRIIDILVGHKGNGLSNEEKRQEISYLNASRSEESSKEYVSKKFGKRPKENERDLDLNTGLLFSQEHPKKVYKNSQRIVKQSQAFNAHLKDILQKGTEQDKIKALQQFLYNGVRTREGEKLTGMGRFNSFELKTIFNKLWDLNAHDQMVEMMENSENKHFTTDSLNLALYARAILKGHYINLNNARAIANLLMETPSTRSEGLAINGIIHAMSKRAAKKMLYEIDKGQEIKSTKEEIESLKKEYQRCFPGASMERATVLENYCNSLSHALVNFEESFLDSWDCRYGCRAMHLLLEQKSPEKAQEMAELTKLAAQKEGGLKSNNFAVVRAYLEALYVLPDSSPKEIKLAQKVLISLCKNPNLVANAIEGISELEINPDIHADLRRNFCNSQLASHYYQLTKYPAEAQEQIKQIKAEIQESVDVWERYTFNYKGLTSNHIEGNFRFGAQLPAHNINRYDRKFFEEVLTTPLKDLFDSSDNAYAKSKNLKQIKTFDQFNTIVDAFIREKFHTDEWELERLDSEGHKLFDQSVQSLIALSGAPTQETRKLMPDSRTNISTNLILGLGDCRHHSQVKQILFDIWHSHQLETIMKKIHKATAEGDQNRVDSLTKQFNAIDAEQLHTLDCEVYLPIEMKEGFPVWHEGHLVKNKTGTLVKVEEHTLNVQMEFNSKTNKLEEVKLRDSFYQHTYPWNNCEIDLNDKDLTDGVNAGLVEIYDAETGKLESLPAVIKPTAYAGSRELYDKGNNDNRFIGQPVKQLSFAEASEHRSEIKQHLSQVREWHQEMLSQNKF